MTLFSAFNSNQKIYFIALVLTISSYLIFSGEYIVASMAFLFLLTGLIVPDGKRGSCDKIFNDDVVRQLRDVLIKSGAGDLSTRVTSIPEGHVLSSVAWGLSDLLDQLEQFMRDIHATILAADEGNSASFKNTKAYGLCDKHHESVHNHAIEASKCVIRQDCLNKETKSIIVKHIRAMEESSSHLFTILDQMVDEANPR